MWYIPIHCDTLPYRMGGGLLGVRLEEEILAAETVNTPKPTM